MLFFQCEFGISTAMEKAKYRQVGGVGSRMCDMDKEGQDGRFGRTQGGCFSWQESVSELGCGQINVSRNLARII